MKNKFDFTSFENLYGQDNLKWNACKNADTIPMWVADMHFKTPQVIIDAVKDRISLAHCGYTVPPKAAIKAVIDYQKRVNNLEVQAEWIVFTPGVVPAITISARTFTEPDQEIIIFSPYYPPFFLAPQNVQRKVTVVQQKHDQKQWTIDFEAFEAAITQKTKLVIISNPSNPVGRVWTSEELNQLLDLCEKYNLTLLSDEIHADLILNEECEHLSTLALRNNAHEYTITATSPSKTYNIAGFTCAYVIIPNEKLRTQFIKQRIGLISEINVVGYAALIAAYNNGEEWRQELIKQLRTNALIVENFFNNFPQLKTWHVDATFLAWIDISKLKISNPVEYFESYGVKISSGYDFGMPGYIRISFACPEHILLEALERMRRAIDAL